MSFFEFQSGTWIWLYFLEGWFQGRSIESHKIMIIIYQWKHVRRHSQKAQT